MISANEIKKKAERKYLSVLQSKVKGNPFSRLTIRGNKSYTKSTLAEFKKELLDISSQSKQKKGFGYSLEFQTVKTKHLSTQDLPTSIYFETEKDFLQFIGKEREAAKFMNDVHKIYLLFPELKEWIIQNPAKVIHSSSEWDNILLVCNYFKAIPIPNLYTRELPINVHTKFIERNQSIIKDLLNILIADNVKTEFKNFEKRFNLKYNEPQIRFKILDKELSNRYFSGLDDLAIPLSQFEKLNLPVSKVIVVENKTTLYTTLTLPNMQHSIAIFGSGYSVSNLKNVEWLRQLDLIYCGDIDAQGFEILSQFRGYFPNTKSVLMDQFTFEKFFENDLGTPTKITTHLNLTKAEQALYALLKANNWRLEQEKIPYEYVNQIFENR